MMLKHKFVDKIPDFIEEGILYVSIPYETAIHKCCCGCGSEVVTPLSPADWSVIFNGESISLDPSIGNWSFKCRSHYWITRNKVIWSTKWTDKRIAEVRARDFEEKAEYFDKTIGENKSTGDKSRTTKSKRKTHK
jgi:Family of unknown function (DUF6527)